MPNAISVVPINAGAATAARLGDDDIEAQVLWQKTGTIPLAYVYSVVGSGPASSAGFEPSEFLATLQVEALLAELDRATSPQRIDDLEDQLFALGSHAVQPLMTRVRDRRASMQSRVSALRVLVALDAKRARPLCVEASIGPEDQLREVAVEGLATLLPDPHIEGLLRLLASQDPNQEIRRIASEAISSG